MCYGSLVESEGNHYATYILMARGIDDAETPGWDDFHVGKGAGGHHHPFLIMCRGSGL